MMYCWDAFTGKLLWENANPCTCYGSIRTLSADGSSLWRVFEGRDETAVQKIDGRTGEVLLSALWPGEFWEPMADQPMESPDGTRAFLTMQMSGTSSLNRTEMLLVFDTRTGELLWRLDLDKDSQEWREANESGSFLTTEQLREAGRVLPEERKGFVQAAFSKDGKYIYCVQNVIRKETKDPGVCVDRLDAETGKIMEEICLPLADQKIKLWEEEEAFVLVDQKHNEVNTSDLSVYSNDEWAYPSYAGAVRDVTVEHTVRIFDLAKWDYTAEIPFTYLRSPEAHNQTLAAVRSLDGGMALIWETENGDGDGEEFCCRLEKDGSLGPVCEAESEAGRRLWVAKDQYISFMGQEAFLQNGRLYRLSDGVLLLQSAWNASLQVTQHGTGVLFTEGSNVERGIKASKDGTSICMYSSYAGTTKAPFLVLPSDLDTLVEKGRRRIGAD